MNQVARLRGAWVKGGNGDSSGGIQFPEVISIKATPHNSPILPSPKEWAGSLTCTGRLVNRRRRKAVLDARHGKNFDQRPHTLTLHP